MAMAFDPESPIDRLWKEYAQVFQDFDDLTLARWMAQTLGQLQGRAWRLSHPLMGTYRLAAQLAHKRQIWLKRLAAAPSAYLESPCCRAPFLPLVTRDVKASGFICVHCSETLTPFEEIPANLQEEFDQWAQQYGPFHAVAHWDEAQRDRAGDYEEALDDAADEAESLLVRLGSELMPQLLEHFPAAVWEDQDECLSVQPEDIGL